MSEQGGVRPARETDARGTDERRQARPGGTRSSCPYPLLCCPRTPLPAPVLTGHDGALHTVRAPPRGRRPRPARSGGHAQVKGYADASGTAVFRLPRGAWCVRETDLAQTVLCDPAFNTGMSDFAEELASALASGADRPGPLRAQHGSRPRARLPRERGPGGRGISCRQHPAPGETRATPQSLSRPAAASRRPGAAAASPAAVRAQRPDLLSACALRMCSAGCGQRYCVRTWSRPWPGTTRSGGPRASGPACRRMSPWPGSFRR